MNHYEILGVSKNASLKEIEAAYRKLTIKYHPDRNLGNKKESEKKFQEINNAYSVLKDPEKRKAYDISLLGGGDYGNSQQDFSGYNSFFSSRGSNFSKNSHSHIEIDIEDIGDILNSMFSNSNSFRDDVYQSESHFSRVVDGEDININININFKDIIFSRKIAIEFLRSKECRKCNNAGYTGEARLCSKCNGKGFTSSNFHNFFLNVKEMCKSCMGVGKTPGDLCKSCNGKGILKELDTIYLYPSKEREVVLNKGNSGFNGGKIGDLYIDIIPYSDIPLIEINKRKDIIVNFPILIEEMIDGKVFNFVFFGKKINLLIPKKSKDGQLFCFRRYGLFGNGDLIFKLNVSYPNKSSDIGKIISLPEREKLFELLKESN